jgi:hypothetical protein
MPGTTDGPAPEAYTPSQLSRVMDMLEACKRIDTECNTKTFQAFWKALPYTMQMEFNYAKWEYVKATV